MRQERVRSHVFFSASGRIGQVPIGDGFGVFTSGKAIAMKKVIQIVCVAVVVVGLGSAAPAGTVIVAVTGQDAPDANGTFDMFSRVALNDLGQAVFNADLSGTSDGIDDDEGIFLGSGAAIAQIVREGQDAPDGNGTYGFFTINALNDSGQVAFWADLNGTSGFSTDDTGIFRGSGQEITQIVREGQDLPDGNGRFANFGAEPALNNLGHVAFQASLAGTSGGTTDNGGIFRGSQETIVQIAREGQTAPDGNGTFSVLDEPQLSSSGQVAFYSTLTGTSGGGDDNSGIFRGSVGAITQIAREGQATPDGDGTFSLLSGPLLNSSGQVAFEVHLTGTSDESGVFRGSGGTITQIARTGQAAPDGNGVFRVVRLEGLDASGQAGLGGALTDTSGGFSDGDGIFLSAAGAITQIARAGQGAPDGNGTLSSIGPRAFNGSGHAAFYAALVGTSEGGLDNNGIYISDGIDLIQIARENQALAGSTVTGLTFTEGVDERNGLNEFGQVAYKADLLDGREVVAVFTPKVHWRTAGSGNWLQSNNWTLGITPAAMYDVLIVPAGSLNVNGNPVNTTVKSLTVGSTGGGVAALQLNNGGDLAAEGAVTITGGGRIEVGEGHVLSATALTNHGVLTGSGTIQAPLANHAGGQVRISSGRQMIFAGTAHANAGKIETIGGEIEFTGDLTNAVSTGLITGRDATLRFTGGLTNSGLLALSFGASDVSGEIGNTVLGRIVVSGNSQATFYDDMVNNGEVQVSAGSTAVYFGDVTGAGAFTGTGRNHFEGELHPGSSPAELTFGGDVVFGSQAGLEIELGGTVEGDEHDSLDIAGNLMPGGALQVVLIDDFTPGVGDTFDILDWGSLTGAEFNEIELPGLVGRKVWDTSDLYDTGEISVIGMLDGDTDVDWDVDSVDLANLAGVFGGAGDWHTDFNEDGRVDLTDFAMLRGNFGAGVGSSPIGGPGAATPEPATLSLLVLGGLAMLRRRRE